MIDDDLISRNKAKVRACLDSRKSIISGSLFALDSVLDDDILTKIKIYLDRDSLEWHDVETQVGLPRKKITWDSDTVIEELHEIFSSLTQSVNHIFPGKQKHFWGISLWKDSAGYYLPWHIDNPELDVAMQIYLFDQTDTGTVFKYDDSELLIESNHNTGYLVKNSPDPIYHKTQRPVPAGIDRYSLYVIWSRLPKHMPDA